MRDLVYRLGYVAMNVANYDECIDDAINVAGFNLVDRNDERALFTCNTRHAEMMLYRAPKNEMRAIGFEAYDEDSVAEVAERVRKAGLKIVTEKPSLPVIDRAVTFLSSEGHVFEVHTPMPRDRALRYVGPGVHPLCVDHVNLAAVDAARLAQELSDTIGLKVSERTTGDELVWLRAGDGRHHTVGILKGRSGIHHYSLEFGDFADFRRLGDNLDTLGRRIVWGPGRHGAGDNLFAYYKDAGGFMVECTSEMEVINDVGFQPRTVDPGENLSNYRVVNRWGQLPSAEWMEHHTVFAAPSA